MSNMAAHLATMIEARICFCKDLGDQQPAKMHVTGDASQSIRSLLIGCHIQVMWG